MTFPKTHLVSGVSVKIYRVREPKGKTGWAYVASWIAADGRQTKKFSDEAEATKHAKEQARVIAQGKQEQLERTTRADIEELAQARELAGDVPLLVALREWKKSRESKPISRGISIADAVKEFKAWKEGAGIQYKKSFGRTFPDFVAEFGEREISELGSDEMNAWFGRRHPNAASRNSHRERLVTLWRWAQDRNYVPQGKTQIQLVPTMRPEPLRIGIVTPEDAARCIAHIKAEYPHYLPALGLALFCGMRRSEVHGQKWDDIDATGGHLRVTAAKPNTPSFRLVQVRPAALAMLGQRPAEGGPVCSTLDLDRIREACIKHGIPLPENCFRHAWISYMVALTGNVDEVAHEAGNSRQEIFQHYRQLVTRAQAEAFFSLRP